MFKPTLCAIMLCVSNIAHADNYFLQGNTYMEVGAGSNNSWFNNEYKWRDNGGVGFYGQIRHEWPAIYSRIQHVIHYTHISQWEVGPPFNNKHESSVDHVGVSLRIKLR